MQGARLAAVVAISTRARQHFAKVSQLDSAPALGGLGVVEHLAQLLASQSLLVLQGLAGLGIDFLLDQKLGGANVGSAKIQNAFGRIAIAARAPGLLVIAFQCARQVVVDHPANIGLVDAHAKCDGGDDDASVVTNKSFLIASALFPAEPRVIGKSADAV